MSEPADHTDNELFARMKRGDSSAFTLLYERYNKMLYVLASRYLQDGSMAEDAVQHVFTKLWEAHAMLNVDISVRNYLFTMMKNYLLNTIRHENNVIEKNYYAAAAESEVDDSLVAKLEEKELRGILNKAIAQLPEQKRLICLMKMEGKQNQEIAEKMNLSTNTIKTHYFQTIQILRAKLCSMLTIVTALILLSALCV